MLVFTSLSARKDIRGFYSAICFTTRQVSWLPDHPWVSAFPAHLPVARSHARTLGSPSFPVTVAGAAPDSHRLPSERFHSSFHKTVLLEEIVKVHLQWRGLIETVIRFVNLEKNVLFFVTTCTPNVQIRVSVHAPKSFFCFGDSRCVPGARAL